MVAESTTVAEHKTKEAASVSLSIIWKAIQNPKPNPACHPIQAVQQLFSPET